MTADNRPLALPDLIVQNGRTYTLHPVGFGSKAWMVTLNDGRRGGLLFPSRRNAVTWIKEQCPTLAKGEA